MSNRLIKNSSIRTLMAVVAISCYIFVSFAQSPSLGTSTVQRVERDKNGEAIVRPQRNSDKVVKKDQDTSNNPLVDYDADVITNRGDKIMRLIGNVHFHHNGAIIQCDSAFQYDDNRMDFFGKVVIQKDSAFIYGDRVNYDGRTNLADVFAPIVKMAQGNTTLYSYNLQFNTKTNVGTFTRGGVLSQKGNLMEAERGSFDAKAEYARFLDSVAMRNDDYIVRTDSLGYDSKAERVDFLDRTYIWSKDSNFLMADFGNYFTSTKTYLFTSNAYAMTPDNEVWADTMRYLTDGRRAYMFSNVQLLDTANTSLGFGDWGYYDDSLGRALLTIKPSVRVWDKGDTSYMKADTIMMLTFDAGKSKLPDDEFEEDSVTQSGHNSSTPTTMDTTVVRDSLPSIDSIRRVQMDSLARRDSSAVDLPKLDTTLTAVDSLPAPTDSLSTSADPLPPTDTTTIAATAPPTAPPSDIPEEPQAELQTEEITADTTAIGTPPLPLPTPTDTTQQVSQLDMPNDDSTQKAFVTADTITFIDWDQFPYVDRKTKKSAGQLSLWDEIAIADLVMIRDTIIPDSALMSHADFIREENLAREQARRDSIKKAEKERVMRAYHKVRLWSEEYQGICDSTVSFSVDSTSVMYGEPILWSKANQITSEEITMYTKNEHLDWADFTGDPFIAQQVVKNDTSMFNQATGKQLQTFFINDELDYAYMSGNVQNIYYMDEELEVVALAAITCAELTILFTDREPTRMIWQGQGEGPIYPIEKVPAEQSRFLEGFTWQDSLRPKSAYEICQRTERPSQRAQCTVYQRPPFRINIQMEQSKLFYREAGKWTDRTDVPNVTPEYFIERNQQLLF